MEETINHIKSQNLIGFANYHIADKEQLHQLVCRIETIATSLRNLT
jgi:Holliday junction resolvase-like predicted endonuclease